MLPDIKLSCYHLHTVEEYAPWTLYADILNLTGVPHKYDHNLILRMKSCHVNQRMSILSGALLNVRDILEGTELSCSSLFHYL